MAREIDIFETEIALRKQGKIDERLFAETRLRRGVYGQRYDNGQRHDGKKVQEILYPSGELTKGPNTMWDAPGMQRIKIPGGGLNAEQLETMAELAEEYSDGIAHVTTRQDFQLHYIHIDDTPSLMRRLAAAGITTREACGNSVRNVTACPYAGVCPDEVFDVTPYSHALSKFLLGHPDCQNFGRKFKPAFSGCAQHACGLTNLHDLGLIAVKRSENGQEKRGFQMYVGGGLGAVPYNAKLFDSFVPSEELLPLTQAIARVFAKARREEESQPGSNQIPDSGSRDREIQGIGARRTQDSASRSSMDGVREGRRAFRGGAAQACRGMAPIDRRGLPALAQDEHSPAEATRLCGRNGCASVGRHHGQPASVFGGHRPPLYEGNSPDDRRTELRHSLGQPERSIRAL